MNSLVGADLRLDENRDLINAFLFDLVSLSNLIIVVDIQVVFVISSFSSLVVVPKDFNDLQTIGD